MLLGGGKRRTRNATVYSGIALADCRPKPRTTPRSVPMSAFGGKRAKPHLDGPHEGDGSPPRATRPSSIRSMTGPIMANACLPRGAKVQHHAPS